MYIRYELEDTDDFEKYDDIDDDAEMVCLWYVYTSSGRRVAAFCTEAQAKEAVEIYNSYRSEGRPSRSRCTTPGWPDKQGNAPTWCEMVRCSISGTHHTVPYVTIHQHNLKPLVVTKQGLET